MFMLLGNSIAPPEGTSLLVIVTAGSFPRPFSFWLACSPLFVSREKKDPFQYDPFPDILLILSSTFRRHPRIGRAQHVLAPCPRITSQITQR